MSLADEVEGLYDVLGEHAPKTFAHSIALRVMAKMLQDILGKAYSEEVDIALKTFASVGADQGDEFQQKLMQELQFIFDPE
jgi:hypothetical protein